MRQTMQTLALDSATIRAALAAKGVITLHYAAGVDDACRFLRAGALLADQHPGHVFLDPVDVHARERRRNKCGPVLFVLHAAILRTDAARAAGVCRAAPSAWAGRTHDECWFADGGALARGFTVGRHEQMVVIRDCGGRLPFGGHLMQVLVDPAVDAWPGVEAAWDRLRQAGAEGGLAVPLLRRSCEPGCGCAP